MTDNPTLSLQRPSEDRNAALRPKSLAEFVGTGGSAAWNDFRKDIYLGHG